MLNIVLFGPPGAGKGTQSERIIDKYDLIHLSTEIFLESTSVKEQILGNYPSSTSMKATWFPMNW
jgi:adenylate kinase